MMYNKSSDKTERRKHDRINSLNLSHIKILEHQHLVQQGMGRTLNLSESGTLLELNFPILLKDDLLVTIAIDEHLVDLRGRIIHLDSLENGAFIYGIEFECPEKSASDIIRQHLKPQE